MTKAELHMLQSSLFAAPLLEHDHYVIDHVVSANVTDFHECLRHCPRLLSHLIDVVGLSFNTICAYHIGYVDTAKFEAQLMVGRNNHYIQRLKGCFTLPIFHDGQITGIYGLRYLTSESSGTEESFISYADMPTYSPFTMKETALLCDELFGVLALAEMGYQNGVAILGEGITSMSLAALKEQGVKTLVIFINAQTNTKELAESEALAKLYGIVICKVLLPFHLVGFGKWDGYQWRLFDIRLSRALLEMGEFNERYQA